MTRWVALLRGVNVGGVTIRSAELGDVFRQLGFGDVRTVLASGNVVFSDEAAAPAALKNHIETALRERFRYDAWILLVTREQLDSVIAGYPFDADDASRQPYVVFCSDEKVKGELLAAAASFADGEDDVAEGGDVIYWSPPVRQTTDTPFGKLLGRATYKPTTTTRNMRTLAKIAATPA